MVVQIFLKKCLSRFLFSTWNCFNKFHLLNNFSLLSCKLSVFSTRAQNYCSLHHIKCFVRSRVLHSEPNLFPTGFLSRHTFSICLLAWIERVWCKLLPTFKEKKNSTDVRSSMETLCVNYSDARQRINNMRAVPWTISSERWVLFYRMEIGEEKVLLLTVSGKLSIETEQASTKTLVDLTLKFWYGMNELYAMKEWMNQTMWQISPLGYTTLMLFSVL